MSNQKNIIDLVKELSIQYSLKTKDLDKIRSVALSLGFGEGKIKRLINSHKNKQRMKIQDLVDLYLQDTLAEVDSILDNIPHEKVSDIN